MWGGETLAIAVMAGAAYAAIRIGAYILDNIPEALQPYGDWPHVPDEAKPTDAGMLSEVGGRQAGRRPASNAHKQETGTSLRSRLGTHL